MPSQERRLIALLNLMTSTNPGEKANATDAACRYITAQHITWMELQRIAAKLRTPSVLDTIYTLLFQKTHQHAGHQTKEKTKEKAQTKQGPKAKTQKAAQPDAYKTCPQCGNEFRAAYGDSPASPQGTSYGRPRTFCSDACKMKAYRARVKATKGKSK